ncbi:hypothetical protein Gotri_026680, partial [Gossypium trilobum]|nr:hypothetical protein [Gossypium trilobum]
SFTWKSVWSAKGLLEKGLCWRVGRGDKISVCDDLWIPGNKMVRISNQEVSGNIELVSELIDTCNRRWKIEMVKDTFQPDIVEKVLKIPLAETEHDDFQVWRGEPTGEFSVRSAYKLLHESLLDPNELILHTETTNFYKKLWNLHIPSKIKMMIWRISWNFIPSFCNLKIKRVVVNTQCPRNQLVYEKKKVLGTEIARKVRSYISELEATKEDKLTLHSSDKCHQVFKRGRATVHFDAAFDRQTFRSASGLIAWNGEGEILASQAVHHSNIEDPFTAEAYAGLQAVKLGISLGINILEVMGDSKTVIKKCQSSSIDRSVIGAIIRDIQSKKRRYQKVEFSFIPKVNNIYAHTIATEALKSGESFYLERGIPELVQMRWRGETLERRDFGKDHRIEK